MVAAANACYRGEGVGEDSGKSRCLWYRGWVGGGGVVVIDKFTSNSSSYFNTGLAMKMKRTNNYKNNSFVNLPIGIELVAKIIKMVLRITQYHCTVGPSSS